MKIFTRKCWYYNTCVYEQEIQIQGGMNTRIDFLPKLELRKSNIYIERVCVSNDRITIHNSFLRMLSQIIHI